MNRQITTIARYTLLEARRTRLPQLVLSAIVLLGAAGFFVQEIAVTESTRLQTGFYAATMRLTGVFIIGLYVLSSVAREFSDKGLDVALALDLPRSHYILGKLAGFLVIGVLVAIAVSMPLALLAAPGAALQWGVSLAFELAIVVALSLFCIVTFSQLMPAASFVLAFYLLARALTAVRLMSAHPLTGADTLSHQFMSMMMEGLALVMPALDAWTRTAWLVDQPAVWTEIGVLAGQSALYVALLAGATMFDFYRKNF
ncbi:MAG: ABC transporter permease [Burkholderiales bacterium]|nr:ABC transporter permease [Burkholderiales bacterium]